MNESKIPRVKLVLYCGGSIVLIIIVIFRFQDLIDRNSACYFVKGVSERWLSIRLHLLTTSCVFIASYLIVTMKEQILPAIAGLTIVYILQVPRIIQRGMRSFSKAHTHFSSVQNICNYLQVSCLYT